MQPPGMLIRRFTVRNFKSLEDVDVELGWLNVFIGANGSGKSNFLEAIGVLGAAASGRVDDESLLRRGVRPGVPALYRSSFRGKEPCGSVRLEAAFAELDPEAEETASYTVELEDPTAGEAAAWSYKTELWEGNGGRIVDRTPDNRDQDLADDRGLAVREMVNVKSDDPAARLLSSLEQYAIYSPNTATLRGLNPDPQQRQPVGLSGGRLPEAVRTIQGLTGPSYNAAARDDLLRLIDWAKAIDMAPVGSVPLSPAVPATRNVLVFRDRFMADDGNLLTGYDVSEGALYVLFAAVLAAHPEAPRVLAIDNLDACLNPRLARELMKCLYDWVMANVVDKQILLTSHNPLLLDGLPLQDDRVRLFAVDRSRKGRTVIHRVEVDEDLLAKAQEGWTLSRLWVMGHLGGVPDV